ncbi:Crocetin glucosyltransferase 3 [Acorus gramineus]|uniref:Glycosyltransferase n=1 Tax=Acorus gramineus TaxID=55184 RepID=A0AAV9ATP4_ACOGR|nr:Crocetin glucosyltransferase 3 [Acorus gramineus]
MGGNSEQHHNYQEHVLLFPFMAQGHIIPFVELAKLIHHRRRCTITVVSTPSNIRALTSSFPSTPTFRLVPLPFDPTHHSLSSSDESSDTLPTHHIVRLLHASRSLRPAFSLLLSDILSSPSAPSRLCVIADIFTSWACEVAESLSVYHAVFTTCGGYGTTAYFSLWQHLPHAHTDADEFAVPGFPNSFRLRRSQLSSYMRAADGADQWSAFFQPAIATSLKSKSMLCNSVEEVETTGFRLLRDYTGLRVYDVGPLLPFPDDKKSSYKRAGKAHGLSVDACVELLDAHPPNSVLYVSFGSQNTISARQMMELAKGIEASGEAFIWVIRPPVEFDIGGEFQNEWLPEGFEERARQHARGVLVRDWAPQLEILSHVSTGAFLSHCGWNSALESLSRGVPLIGWPLASEQFYNSVMLEEELGVCVEVARGKEVVVQGEEVERVVREVMGEERGAEMRRRAAEVRRLLEEAMREGDGETKGSSLRAIDEFLEVALSGKSAMNGGCLN